MRDPAAVCAYLDGSEQEDGAFRDQQPSLFVTKKFLLMENPECEARTASGRDLWYLQGLWSEHHPAWTSQGGVGGPCTSPECPTATTCVPSPAAGTFSRV